MLAHRVSLSMAVVSLVLATYELPVVAQQGGPSVKLQAFDMGDVTLADGPCLVGREANRGYLHELDVDRLLWAFRKNAGLPTGEAQPLGGWEAPEVEVRGHFPGHYLSACAMMYRATGDEELKRRGRSARRRSGAHTSRRFLRSSWTGWRRGTG
jgi:hypothetical protein